MSSVIACVFLGILFSGINGEVFPPMSDYDLHFPNKGVDHGLFITEMKTLGSRFTLCLWMQSTESHGSLFSYALSNDESNEILLDYSSAGFGFYIGGEGRLAPFSANDTTWHHICAAWTATGGLWKLYKDGVLADIGTDLQTGHQIPGGGIVVLGQDQDNFGSGFSAQQSYKGLLTNYNLWDDMLSDSAIEDLAKSCRSGEGNVFKWSEFLNEAARVVGWMPFPSLCRQ